MWPLASNPSSKPIDQIFLPDDDAGDFLAQSRDPTTYFLNLLCDLLR